MTYQGIDTAARISAAQAAKIKAAGVSFVGRYLIPDSYSNALTEKEAKLLRDAGLAILLCWEIGAEAMRGGAKQGTADGAKARKLAEAFGVPAGTAIYFAADFNVPQKDLLICEKYLTAAQAALGRYRVGAYGPLVLVEFLRDRGHDYPLWQCVAWSARFSDYAHVRQYAWQGASDAKAMAAQIGLPVDLNATEDLHAAGLWMPGYAQFEDNGGIIMEPEKDKPTGNWYDEAMAWAKEAGLIRDGRPDDPVTRAELATVLMRFDERVRRLVPGDDSLGGLIADD